MVSKVGTRPTHYETLGLSPTATNDEISRAFARQSSVFRPHAFGVVTELCVAYETLRDPAKRRAYDTSLGFEPEPAPAKPVGLPSIRIALPLAPAVNPKVRPESSFERTVGSSIASSLRRPANPPGRDTSPAPAAHPQPAIETVPRPEPQVAADRSPYLAVEELDDIEGSPIEWKRAGMALGGVLLASCLVGGLAGWWSASDVGQAAQPANAVSVPLPPADLPAAAEVAPPASVPSAVEARPDRPKPVMAASRIERSPAPAQLAAAEAQPQLGQRDESAPQPGQPEASASEQDAEEAPVAAAAAASLPLPNRTIARTIERIGYSCGSVASTSPVEGEAAGVYKVTCTSGQSYQARPVNGRYRFRRWGRQ